MSQTKSIDPAVTQALESARQRGLSTVWDRSDDQKPRCGFGESGACCHLCYMGPCRISPTGKKMKLGVCGASAEIIVARNFCRMIAAGAAAHADHGREVAQTLRQAALNPDSGYAIKDARKLKKVAAFLGVGVKNRTDAEIALDVADKAAAGFGQQHGEGLFVQRAPEKRQALWRGLNIVPRGIDREVVELIHRTSMGVDQDFRNIMLQGARTALADGWGGSMVATELQDILFGTPSPIRAQVNLGVLSGTDVNIIVHGHEPLLSEMLACAAREPEFIALAKAHGASGINLAGICCTANEVLIRHGLPIAGNMLQQELAVATGAVEAMIVDVQCIMPSLPDICRSFHTKLISTSRKGRVPGAEYIDFSAANALAAAREIVRTAVMNFPNRKDVDIPAQKMDLIAGFSHEAINYMLGGTFRGSYTPLNDNIINGRIKGVAAVVGCSNPKVTHDRSHVDLVEELIANDILVVQTGCSAIACAKAGFLTPKTAEKKAGPGLAEVCEAVGMPPVLHSGSCVDNSRILIALAEMVRVGGLGSDISDLPVAGAAPEWMSEKAIAIGQYFVASGVFTVFGVGLPVTGSRGLPGAYLPRFRKDVRRDVAGRARPAQDRRADHRPHPREESEARDQRGPGPRALRYGIQAEAWRSDDVEAHRHPSHPRRPQARRPGRDGASPGSRREGARDEGRVPEHRLLSPDLARDSGAQNRNAWQACSSSSRKRRNSCRPSRLPSSGHPTSGKPWTRAWPLSSPTRSSRRSNTLTSRSPTSPSPPRSRHGSGSAPPTTSSCGSAGSSSSTAPRPASRPAWAPARRTGGGPKIARELQEKNLYVFMSGGDRRQVDGRAARRGRDRDGLEDAPRAVRTPMSRPRFTPSVSRRAPPCPSAAPSRATSSGSCRYNKNRVFAFVLAFGPVDDEKHAQAAGAINYGFPTIADTDIDRILPTGICTYEHVVSPVAHGQDRGQGHRGPRAEDRDHQGPDPRPLRPGLRGRAGPQGGHVCRARRPREEPGFELLLG